MRYFRFSPNLDSGMISSLANNRPFFSLFRHIPPSGQFLSSQLISMRDKRNGGFPRRNVYSLKIVAKSFGNGSLDICKYKESNLEPFADF